MIKNIITVGTEKVGFYLFFSPTVILKKIYSEAATCMGKKSLLTSLEDGYVEKKMYL